MAEALVSIPLNDMRGKGMTQIDSQIDKDKDRQSDRQTEEDRETD